MRPVLRGIALLFALASGCDYPLVTFVQPPGGQGGDGSGGGTGGIPMHTGGMGGVGGVAATGGAGGSGGAPGGQGGMPLVCIPPEHACPQFPVCAPNNPETGCFKSTDCEPCPDPPANGVNTCTQGGQCDFECPGYMKDMGECICPEGLLFACGTTCDVWCIDQGANGMLDCTLGYCWCACG